MLSDRYIRYMGNETKYQQYQLLEDTMQRMEGEVANRKDAGNIMRWHGNPESDRIDGYANGVFLKGKEIIGGFPSWQTGNGSISMASVKFDNSLVVRTSNENRPKTIMIKCRIVKALK